MERKEFLKTLGFSLFTTPIILGACKSSTDATATTTTTTSGTCAATNDETAGPFPTITPATLTSANIVSDRTGNAFTIKINITNLNKSCAALAGAVVDIWHCDAAGNYSEYGGTGMQSTNYTSVHFLRGRQTTDVNGLVTFNSIFPGWYGGRAPHIHVHVYSSSGTSLLVTQIAFPEDVCNTVYTQGVYASKGKADTKNASDNVFSDGFANEMGVISGTIATGLTLTHTVNVKG